MCTISIVSIKLGMNRFEYAQAVLREDESFVAKHERMKLYHGHHKVRTIGFCK